MQQSRKSDSIFPTFVHGTCAQPFVRVYRTKKIGTVKVSFAAISGEGNAIYGTLQYIEIAGLGYTRRQKPRTVIKKASLSAYNPMGL